LRLKKLKFNAATKIEHIPLALSFTRISYYSQYVLQTDISEVLLLKVVIWRFLRSVMWS